MVIAELPGNWHSFALISPCYIPIYVTAHGIPNSADYFFCCPSDNLCDDDHSSWCDIGCVYTPHMPHTPCKKKDYQTHDTEYVVMVIVQNHYCLKFQTMLCVMNTLHWKKLCFSHNRFPASHISCWPNILWESWAATTHNLYCWWRRGPSAWASGAEAHQNTRGEGDWSGS